MTGAAAWDDQAETFDDAADHGLRDPGCGAPGATCWRRCCRQRRGWPTSAAGRAAWPSCSSGSATALWAWTCRRAMVRAARAKAAGTPARFVVGDAGRPALAPGAVDVVLCRHVLWALPRPAEAVAGWTRLLAPGGLLVLVEGGWATGAGLRAEQTRALVRQSRQQAEVTALDDPALWGGPVADERYLVVSRA